MDLGKESTLNHFMKIGVPSDTIYRVCQCLEKRKTAKRRAESRRRAVQMPEKKTNQLVKAIYEKEGVTSKKPAANLNVDRFFGDQIVRDASVMTYRRALCPEFSPELVQRQKRARRKETGKIIHFESHQRRGRPSWGPITSFYCGFGGCPPAGG